MEFLQDCIVGFFALVGFGVTVLLAVLYCMEVYVTFVDKSEDPTDVINKRFDDIVRK